MPTSRKGKGAAKGKKKFDGGARKGMNFSDRLREAIEASRMTEVTDQEFRDSLQAAIAQSLEETHVTGNTAPYIYPKSEKETKRTEKIQQAIDHAKAMSLKSNSGPSSSTRNDIFSTQKNTSGLRNEIQNIRKDTKTKTASSVKNKFATSKRLAELINNNINDEDFDAIANAFRREEEAVQTITRTTGSTRIPISGRNNDCMYRAVYRAMIGESIDDEGLKGFKRHFITWFSKPEQEGMLGSVKDLLEFMTFEDKKIQDLIKTANVDAFKAQLAEHVNDKIIASDAEAQVMANYVKSLEGPKDTILFGTASHLLRAITIDPQKEWRSLIVNVGDHYEVIVKNDQSGGSTKNMSYREVQKTARLYGVKNLTRDAATLKRAIAQKKAYQKKKRGGGEEEYDESCTGDSCIDCFDEAISHYITLKLLEAEMDNQPSTDS